jgi:hypothetical protein
MAAGNPRRGGGSRRRVSAFAHRIAIGYNSGSRIAIAPPGGPAAGNARAVQSLKFWMQHFEIKTTRKGARKRFYHDLHLCQNLIVTPDIQHALA